MAAFAALRQAHRPVRHVVVSVANEFNNYFISERGVTALLTKGGREPVIGTVPGGPRLRELEGRLKAHPFVRDAQVYRDLARATCTPTCVRTAPLPGSCTPTTASIPTWTLMASFCPSRRSTRRGWPR
ncbi:MAG: hypothetical protein WKG07_22305 [Hymenobacter sp.]